MSLLTDRLKYEAIIDRPKLKGPNGSKIIVWTTVNVELWNIIRPMPRNALPPPMGNQLLPNVPNWSWHEYGNRVGFWRHLNALQSRNITATLAINGHVCSTYPRIAEAALEAGWEFMGHGYEQQPQHSLDDEDAEIAAAVEEIKSFTGKQPIGWESPGLTETENTLDLLKKNGIEYVCNWPMDDLPTTIETKNGPMLTLPYPLETNDIVIHIIQHQPANVFYKQCKETFDRLYMESEENIKIMAISMHPYLTGTPHRIGHVEKLYDYINQHDGVIHMTGEEIYHWYKSETKTD